MPKYVSYGFPVILLLTATASCCQGFGNGKKLQNIIRIKIERLVGVHSVWFGSNHKKIIGKDLNNYGDF